MDYWLIGLRIKIKHKHPFTLLLHQIQRNVKTHNDLSFLQTVRCFHADHVFKTKKIRFDIEHIRFFLQ